MGSISKRNIPVAQPHSTRAENRENEGNKKVRKKTEAILFSVLNRRKGLSEDETYRFALMLAVAIIACSVHVMFSVFFFMVHVLPLAISHVIGVFVFILSYFLLEKKKYDLSGVVLSVMILFSSLATIYCIGGNNFSIFYQIIVLLMQMVIPFSNRKIPWVFSMLMPVIMIGGYLFDLYHIPPFDIGTANTVLAVMNILVASTGIVILMSLEKLVRSFVESFQEKRLQELQDQAYLDPLTELYNRRFADVYFSQLREAPQARDICLAIADIDDFKLINDTYGHGVGDRVLQMISEMFNHGTRKSDLVFRWGGEEFLLIIHDATIEDTYRLMDTIRERISERTFAIDGADIRLSVTIGIAQLDLDDIQASIQACDRNLYDGKHRGKNMVVQ